MKPSLILLPNLLHPENDVKDYFFENIFKVVSSLDGLIAESEKEARRFLYRFFTREKAYSFPLMLLNEHSSDNDLKEIVSKIRKNERWGLISDCGLPCLADPGSNLVNLAHKNNINVEAYSGPSSIILALMLSGFSAQAFSFYGYLPRKSDELKRKLIELEKRAYKEKMTQMWMEAPYRSKKMLEASVNSLKGSTKLCVAADLTSQSQIVVSRKICDWRKDFSGINLEKKPAIFLISIS